MSWAFEEFNVLAQKARLTVLEVVILSGNVRWKSKDEVCGVGERSSKKILKRCRRESSCSLINHTFLVSS